MGSILSCRCQSCKYSKKKILLGYCMTPGYFYFPCYDTKKGTVEHFNYFEGLEMEELIPTIEENDAGDKFKAKDRLPYFLKEMYKNGNESGKILNESPYLQSSHNYCPKCKEYMLNFIEYGLFD